LTHTVTGLETGAQFLQHVVAQWGLCKQIRTDRGSSFVNNFMSALTGLLGVKLQLSASRNPQSNGRAEAAVKRTKTTIKFHCEKDEDVELHLGSILLGLRATRSTTTDCSPFFLTRGYDPPMPVLGSEPDSPYAPPRTNTSHERSFLEHMASYLRQLQDKAKTNIAESKNAMKRAYDSRHRVKEPTLTVGTKVWLQNLQIKPHSSHVLTHRPYSGPYFITDVLTSIDHAEGPSYRIVHADTGKAHKAPVPAIRLKLCHDLEALQRRFDPQAAPPVSASTDNETGQPNTQSLLPTSPQGVRRRTTRPTRGSRNPRIDSTDSSGPPAAVTPADTPADAAFEPALRIVRQRGRGKDSQYLVLFTNRQKYWCNLNDVSSELLRHWIIKQDKSRRTRRYTHSSN
jgi:hypothetical protein